MALLIKGLIKKLNKNEQKFEQKVENCPLFNKLLST